MSRYPISLVFSRDHDFSHVTPKRERMACRECAFVANQPLIIKRVTELFDNLADYKFVTKAAVNAKGGEVYIFKPECTEKRGMIMCFVAEYLANHVYSSY